MMQISDALAAAYTAAANDIENTTHGRFLAGPDVYGTLSRVNHDLFTNPAAEGLRRHLKIEQLQSWRADQVTVVKTLRALAEAPEQLDSLRESDADTRIAEARRGLLEALGCPDDSGTFGQAAREAARRIRLLEAENERLREDLKRATRSHA
jgi:hypothetical protein